VEGIGRIKNVEAGSMEAAIWGFIGTMVGAAASILTTIITSERAGDSPS
jgi:hypothetical protein